MLIYHGDIQEVHAQLEEYGPRVAKAMDGIFGLRLYNRLQIESKRLLVPEAFEMPKEEADSLICTSVSNDSLFLCRVVQNDISNLILEEDGNVAETAGTIVRTAPRIIITEQGINNFATMFPEYSHLAPLSTLLHESLHFAMYTLLPLPTQVVKAVLLKRLRELGIDSTSPEDIVSKINDRSTPVFANINGLTTLEEVQDHALHATIFERMGMTDSLNVFRRFYVSTDNGFIGQFDAVREKVRSDISSLLTYHKNFSPRVPQYTRNLLGSMSKINVKRNSVVTLAEK